MKTLKRSLLCGVSGIGFAAATLAIAPMAVAQETQTDQRTVERVTVTAERRDVDAQDVSIAVSVFTGEDLDAQGVGDLSDIQQIAPSIAINTYNRSAFVNIRGVGIAQSAPTSNPGVAYYIDGALIPHEQFIGQSFFDVGSIEVLRGPQGTLTGQNSTGGAMYVVSPQPEFDNYSGSLDATIGDYGWTKVVATANVPLGQFAALRGAILKEDRDSFTNNIGPSGSEPGNIDLISGRLNLEVRPSDRMKFNVRYENFDFDTDNNAIKNRNDAVTSDPFTIEEDALSFMRQSGYRLSGEARVDITDGMQVRYLISKQLGTTKDQTDGDRTATEPPRPPRSNVGRVTNVRTEFDTLINEVNLLSTGDGPLQWVVGAFHLNETVPVDLLRDNTNTTDFITTVGGSEIRASAENTSKSVFGQLEYEFNEQFQVVAGLRYSEDEQVYTRTAGPPPVLGTSSQTSDATTGRLALNYRPNDDSLLYASVARGYKAGGVNLTFSDPNFTPERNTVYEAGGKFNLMGDQLQLNTAVFRSDYEDIQLASLRNGLPTTQNAASGESIGAELELQAYVGDLAFNAGVGWLDAQFSGGACINDTNAPRGSVADPNCLTNGVPDGNSFVPDGRTLPFSPEWTISAGAQYEHVFANGHTLTPRIQVSHISDQVATPFPSVNTIVPSREVWDLRLTYRPNDRFLVEAFSTNFFDETYIASQIQNSSSATGGIIYGAPQQTGIRVKVELD